MKLRKALMPRIIAYSATTPPLLHHHWGQTLAHSRQPANAYRKQRGDRCLLKAARARFAHILARAKIHSNTGALPQPPSGEQCFPEPQRTAEYVRAIGAFAKINFHAKVFSLTPLTQYILVPTAS